MQILKRGTRRSLLVVVEKSTSAFVIMALLLQPVSMAGVYGAFSFSRGIAMASEETEKEEVHQDEEEDKEEVESDSSEEEAKDSPEEAVVEEEQKEESSEIVTEVVEETSLLGEEKITEEKAVEEGIVVSEKEEESKEEDLSEETEEEKEEVESSEEEVEVIEEEDEEDIWKENEGGIFETVDPVVLGETYVAPQDEEVTLTFTKLPAEPKSVKIERVKLSAKEKAALGALSDTAYDITSSMEDGTFAYRLTLPIPKGKTGVEVKFFEDLDDLESAGVISQDDTKTKDEVVEVKLDHFTLFIATYSDPLFSVLEDEYTPGETVYAQATDLDPNKFYRININPPTGSAFRISEPSCFNPTPSTTTLTGSYTLPLDTDISDNWSADLKEYINSNCTSVTTLVDGFSVIASETEEEEQHVDVTFCHATPPDTAANGYNQQTTDDDAIFTTGHASEHDADIIPPFTAGEVEFPGKNWDEEGQAILNNNCEAVGELQLIKLLDDGSDVTLWQFQLGESDPRNPDANGLVDFGFVPAGEHVITEIGMTNYSLVGVSGANCAWDEEAFSVIATVEPEETTICTLSNAVDKGSITILKAVEGDDVQDFTFSTTNLDAQSFVLDDDGNSGNEYANSRTFSGLLPGNYSVTEEAVTGWALENLVCSSSLVSLAVPVNATVNLELHPGESITCTYTNKKQVSEEENDAFCGDGILNQESEQCDGTAGVTEGQNFCTFSCKLIPLYDGGGSCSEGTIPVKTASYFVSGTTDPDGRDPVMVPLEGGKEYVVEATGDYSYGGVVIDTSLNRADAGYSSDDNFAGPNLLNDLFGITPGAFYRGVHTLISDMGTGSFGVVDWGDYNPAHVYTAGFTPDTDTEVGFLISDWYDEWYEGDWLSEPNKNQQGFRDNAGGLTLNVYECQAPATGSITVIKDAQPDHNQDFGYVLNPGFEEFVLDDDTDPLLPNTQTFHDLPAGNYTVTEGLVNGWELEEVSCTSNQRSLLSTTQPIREIDLQAGENITCTFVNVAKNSSLTIIKDAVPDSAQDFGYALNGSGFVEFVLDDDTDPLLSNTATFTSLPAGNYTVTEGLVPGWTLSGVSCVSNFESVSVTTEPIRSLTLEPGEAMTCTFTNLQTSSVPVCGDGILNQESEQCDGTAGVTEGQNFCTFSCQLIPLYQGGGVCSEGTEPVLVDTKFVESFMTDGIIPDPVKVSLVGGKEYLVESVGHFGYGGVPHNNTLNRADAGYATDTNWAGANLDTLFGSAATALYRGIHMLISDFGTGTFGVVNWGDYNPSHTYTKHFTPVADTEVQFAISDWYDTWYAGDELSNFNKDQFGFRDNDGGLTLNIYECQGNEQENPRLLLTKSNDSISDETPGNEVVYTLEVTALGGDVNDVTLTDLPPEGFEYVGGSGEGAPFIHEYASPGVWDLGDMNEGETKTVSYKTKISESQDAGLYKDLAFAKGTSGVGTVVFANGEANPFVGTDVNVVINTEPTVMLDEDKEEEKKRKTKTVTQYVLGATLPLTGTSKGLLLGAIALVVAGAGLLIFARRRKGTLAGLLFLGMVSWGMPAVAEGATLSARIETPESVMQTQNFKIGFTTLDVMGRNLEVECYTTGSATPFAEYALESSFGGNSGDCAVTSSVVPVDGDYEFFIRVNALGENPETVESEHVLVTVATTAPGTPTNYDRDDDNCQAVITFTTANDGGKTTKVELYRSTENPFVANASTKVNEQMIGSNTSGSFTENLPGCDEDIFYALRAVAANGNGSGFVGDVDVDTETTTSTRTRVNTVTVPGQASGALSAASTTGEGAVEGVSTEASEEAEGSASGETRDVLGEMTEMNEEAAPQGNWWDMIKAHPWWSLSGLLVLLLLARYGYRRYTSRIKPEL